MQTALTSPAIVRATASAEKGVQGVINRISAITERTWLKISGVATVSLIIFAGRYSATGSMTDFVMTAVTSMTALLTIAISSSRQEGGEK